MTHIFFSRILYKCSPNDSIFFGVKNLLKNCIRTAQFDCYFPFQGFYQVFIKGAYFFSFLNVLKKFESQTIWFDYYYRPLENIDQFLSKAHIADLDQYGLKHIVLSRILHICIFPSKALFLLLEIFLIRGNTG